MDKIDETIEVICNTIQKELNDVGIESEITKMVRALSNLVTANVNYENCMLEASNRAAGYQQSQLTDKDLHCIARMLQSAWDAPDEAEFNEEGISSSRCFYGCMYCKYSHDCNTGAKMHFGKAFGKLENLTGVIVHSYREQPVERTFLPASVFLEHPEEIKWLEDAHPSEYKGFRSYLEILLKNQSSSDAAI